MLYRYGIMLHRRRTQITVVLCIVALCLLARRMSSTTFFLASTEDVGNGPIARDVKQSPSVSSVQSRIAIVVLVNPCYNIFQISSSAGQFSHIPCVINSEVRKNVGLPPKKVEVKCLADESKDNIYVPFSFVKKYFDVSVHSSYFEYVNFERLHILKSRFMEAKGEPTRQNILHGPTVTLESFHP